MSDEVAQELQMPVGPQMLEDVEEPMLVRPATLKDPGIPDQVRDGTTQSDTHFPSQSWCKMCVESRGHDSPHREQSKIDAVVPQLQFDYRYMGDGGPLQIACFLVGADTSSAATHATMVRDSKKMDMPYVVAATAKCVRDLVYSQHTENQRHELRPVDIRSFDVCEENVHTDQTIRSSCVTWMTWWVQVQKNISLAILKHMKTNLYLTDVVVFRP